MKCWRNFSLTTKEFGAWKFDAASEFEKLKLQKQVRDTMKILKSLPYNSKEWQDWYDLNFTIHKRRGFEIHELNVDC